MDVQAALGQLLADAAHASPDDLPPLVERLAPMIDAESLTIYLVDLRQRTLVPLGSGDGELAITGTVGGHAYRLSQPQQVTTDGRTACWLPLCNGTERLGVIRIVTARTDDSTIPLYAQLTAMIGHVISTRRRYGDRLEVIRRREPMLVPAELIRAQLPPLSCTTAYTEISGVLEPCYAVGGDAFDYAVNGDHVHLALFDAVGHGAEGGLRAAVLASVALAAYRNARRGGMDLGATYQHVDNVVRDHDPNGLITGIFAELDQNSGVLRVISAGHPGGVVIRDGRVAVILPTPTALPVTMGDLEAASVVEEALQPGDHLLLYTDGITEARSPEGVLFGEDRLADFMIQALADGLPVSETTRRLISLILEHQNDVLQDDATVLLLKWLGK